MNLRELRKEAGITQKGLSDLLHIPLRTLQHWEGKSKDEYREPAIYIQEWIAKELHKLAYVVTIRVNIDKEGFDLCVKEPGKEEYVKAFFPSDNGQISADLLMSLKVFELNGYTIKYELI